MKKKKILEDHKQVKKKLIPPLLQHSIPLHKFNYTEEILPEIIWIGLIHQSIGYKQGNKLISKFIKAATDSTNSKNYINFSIASNLNKLTKNEKQIFINKLLDNDIFLTISEILSPLIYFYKDSPFSFLNKEVDLTKDEENELLLTLKNCIKNRFDRFQKDSVTAQFIIFYTRVEDGTYHFPKGMKMPNFNSLFNDEDSEEAKSAAAFVRNSVKSDFMMMQELDNFDYSWSKSFWNQSYKLDTCKFMEQDNV